MSGELSTEWSFSGVLVRLYAAFCEASEALPDLEAFLAKYDNIDHRQHADVLLFDQYYRWKHGALRPAEWYLERFKNLETSTDWRLELILEEFGYREDAGKHPAAREFIARFPAYAARRSAVSALPPGASAVYPAGEPVGHAVSCRSPWRRRALSQFRDWTPPRLLPRPNGIRRPTAKWKPRSRRIPPSTNSRRT